MADIFEQLDRANQVTQAANAAGVRPELVHSLIRQESAGNPGAVSPKGAFGMMQVMPATAAAPGFGVQPFDPHDPSQNIQGGTAYLAALLKHFNGDESKALAAYNGGVGNVESGKTDSFPETRQYVANVAGHAGAPAPAAGDIFSQLDAASAAAGTQPAPAASSNQKSVGGFLDNVLTSGKNLATSIGSAAAHPFDTINTMGKVGAGLIENAAPNVVDALRNSGVGKVLQGVDASQRAKGNAPEDVSATPSQIGAGVADFYKKRYGSGQAIGNTLYNDPVGVAGDVTSVLGVGGGLAKAGGLTKTGAALARVGEMVDPLQAASKVVSSLVQNPAEKLAQHVTNVSMQIPKRLRRRELNSPFTPAEAVLNENRGWTSNPFTRFSQGGLDKAEATGAKLTEEFNNALKGDVDKTGAVRTYSLSPVEQILEDQKAALGHDLNAQPKQSAVQGVLDNLKNNPLYSKDKYGVVQRPSQVQVAHPFATTSSGAPVMQTQTVLQPTHTVVGRELIPQTAEELNGIKGNVDKGLTFGERGGTLEETLKKGRHGIDQIIDQNVPGAKAINDRRSQNVVASKALQDAILAKETKRGMGLAEGFLATSPILASTGHPIASALATIPWAYNTLVKHPTLASPVAAAAHAIGTASFPTIKAVEQAALPASRVNEATKRSLTKEEAVARYKLYLAGKVQQ